jgi:hypothetical protein
MDRTDTNGKLRTARQRLTWAYITGNLSYIERQLLIEQTFQEAKKQIHLEISKEDCTIPSLWWAHARCIANDTSAVPAQPIFLNREELARRLLRRHGKTKDKALASARNK